MAGRSHRHTRLVNYGRQKPRRGFVFRLWYIIPIAAILAVITALILGNLLGEMVAADKEPPSAETADKTTNSSPVDKKQIVADFVSLRGITYDTAGEVRKQIPDGATAVSMELFDRSGKPYYESAVAASFGKPCGELTLKNTFKPISEVGLYSSVLFPSTLLSVTDSNKYATTAAYEAMLARELHLAGADEILVCFSSLGMSGAAVKQDLFSAITDYVALIKSQVNGLCVGITLTAADLNAYAGSAELEALCRSVDFCALDLTHLSDTQRLTEVLVSLAPTAMRQEMRLIISTEGKSEEYISDQSELLQKLGANNFQYAEINH